MSLTLSLSFLEEMQIIILDYNQLANIQLQAYDFIQSNPEQYELTSKRSLFTTIHLQ